MVNFIIIVFLLLTAISVVLFAIGIKEAFQNLLMKRSKKKLQLKVAGKKYIGNQLVELTLKRKFPLLPLPGFLPGQYISLKFNISGKDIERCYSLANWSRFPFCYKLVIKREPQGICSGHIYDHLTVGDFVQASMPTGKFYYDRVNSFGNIVLVAGGVGITPMRSMWEYLQKHKKKGQNVVLFYSAKYRDELCYFEDFLKEADKSKGFYFYPFLSQEAVDATINSGRLSARVISTFIAVKDISRLYMCASAQMMEDLRNGLIQAGMSEENIHFELFGVSHTGEAKACKISLGKSCTMDYEGKGTLYQFLETAGCKINGFCKAGICGNCKVKINSGKVKYLLKPDCKLNEGEILPCCCIPESDIILDELNLKRAI